MFINFTPELNELRFLVFLCSIDFLHNCSLELSFKSQSFMTLTLISGDFSFSVFQSYLGCSWYLRDSLPAHFRCCFALILVCSQQFSRLTGTVLLFTALLGASQLFWPGSVRECGAGKANVWFHGSLPHTPQWPLTPVFCVQLPSRFYLALLRCEGWKEMPFPGICFCPSGTRL